MYPLADRRTFSKKFILGCHLIFGLSRARAFQSQPDSKNKPSADDDEVYLPGGEVTAPKLIHYVEPSFSSSSTEAFVEGVVRISIVVTADGDPTDLRVTGGLTAEEDRRALEAVKQWRFAPGRRKGKAVKVRVNVEVVFHLL